MTKAAGAMPLLSVCIATYKRPNQLRRLLESLIAQESGGAFAFEICVADNDSAGSAEPIVRDFGDCRMRVAYAVEPQQNISLARNKSISLSRGEYIVTIDDDLYADTAWLATLYGTARALDADVVHGRVTHIFEASVPTYVRESALFNRPDPATGAEFGYSGSTANALIRRARLQDQVAPFDPAFGRSGGEDTELFRNLRARGCRLLWCREAVVFSPVPPERARLRWLLQRQFRNGNVKRRHSGATRAPGTLQRSAQFPASLLAGANLLAGVTRLTLGTVIPAQRAPGLTQVVSALLAIASHLGVLASHAKLQYNEYQGTPT